MTAPPRGRAAAMCPLLLLLLLAAPARAQEIRMVAGPGCADLPPSPPANLKAAAMDGAVKLTWDKPANGACVTEYQVTVVPVDNTQRSAPLPPQRTPDFTVTISQLQNGQQYKFFVKAYSARYNAGGEAQVVAAPTAACSPAVLPSAPTNLRATPGNATIGLCWGPPLNNGCVDEWRVAVRAVQQNSQRAAPASYLRVNQGACVNITSLQNGQLYELSVQAYSASMKGGNYSSVQATPVAPPQPWRCFPVPGYYPLCSAAAGGRCSPLTCKQQAAASQCGAPFMRTVDTATRAIVQYCAEECGCPTNPGTAGTGSAVNDPPAVRAFDEGVSAGTAALASQANAAARSMGLGTSASATAAASLYTTDSTCCSGPIYPPLGRRDFGSGSSSGQNVLQPDYTP